MEKIKVGAEVKFRRRVTLANVTYRGISALLTQAQPQPIDASLEGAVTLSGPVTNLAGLNGSLRLTKLEAHSVAAGLVCRLGIEW